VRLVLDTNTVVSGLFWQTASARLLDAALTGRIELFTSEILLLELADVLPRRKFAKKLAAWQFGIDALIVRYSMLTTIVVPANIPPTSIDPDDDHVLACALAARVDLVISRDHDLLNLKHFHGIPIVEPLEGLIRIDCLT
jgi:uncharacterized protein